MNEWLIIPRDPLIFRDGKPFTATPGERANSLPFPFPSTVIGAVRTRSGTNSDGKFDSNQLSNLLAKSIQGPVLIELDADGAIAERYFPAPADALVIAASEQDKVKCYALTPIDIPGGGQTDLTGLQLVGRNPQIKDKPYYKAPHLWKWTAIQAWLKNEVAVEPFNPQGLGMEELPRDHRTHVSIQPETQTSREGALFQTSGMEFTGENASSLAIALTSDADLQAGVDFLGGERRIVQWQATSNVFADAACPDDIAQTIIADKSCRLILATPAHFADGYLPSYLTSEFGATVVAAAVPRYQTISGWDYSKPRGGEPKPTRRLAPAGSVYFLDLKQVTDIKSFIKKVWLNNISDDDQARRDGFGLALLGTWKNAEVNQ